MDPLAIITAAGSGLGGTILGGGIVWKLANRWMDSMEFRVNKIFDTMDLLVKKDDCKTDRDLCSKNLAEIQAERSSRINRMENKLDETRDEMGEVREKFKHDRRKTERASRDD